ncbi:MAG: hypothetical protein JWO74_4458 [Solirubrobacterales bacterium]|jgi:hypothetical protein|nr:hypothetical protein [Solirubrobacterales bacterium]
MQERAEASRRGRPEVAASLAPGAAVSVPAAATAALLPTEPGGRSARRVVASLGSLPLGQRSFSGRRHARPVALPMTATQKG